jgi:hypothetical protein
MPYQPPKSLFVQVIKSFDNPPLPEPLKVQICGLFSMGRSAAVLNVMTWDHIKQKRHVQAVLKLYDRPIRRSPGRWLQIHNPHNDT